MQELTTALSRMILERYGETFWLLIYFSIGYALASSVVSLVCFSAAVRKKTSNALTNVAVVVVSILTFTSCIGVLSIFRSVALGEISVPKLSSTAFVVGVFIQLLPYYFLYKDRIETKTP
jgi:hypothetical protein